MSGAQDSYNMGTRFSPAAPGVAGYRGLLERVHMCMCHGEQPHCQHCRVIDMQCKERTGG